MYNRIVVRRILIITLSLYICFMRSNAQERLYFIGCYQSGFFSSFLAVLRHLSFCDKNNLIPIVYWGSHSRYYNHDGFNGSENVWEYYFEPVSHLFEPVSISKNRPLKQLHDLAGYVLGCSLEFQYKFFDSATRLRAYYIISKYVKINPIVKHKVDNFYNTYMVGKKTIGIQIRGTDKWAEERVVSPEEIVSIALQYADNDTQFFLMTDQQQYLDRMIQLLAGKTVVYYDCARSVDAYPLPYRRPLPSLAQFGEDVVVEVLLLSQCNMIINTLSNVSTAALYFNPALEHHVVMGRNGLSTVALDNESIDLGVTINGNGKFDICD